MIVKELIEHSSEVISLKEFLRENMEAFLNSRKKIMEIYNYLKEKGLVVHSYSWFRSLFIQEKTNYLKNLQDKHKKTASIKIGV
jgi:hypothetical protein